MVDGFRSTAGTWVTAAQATRWRNSTLAWMGAATIADQYRADRDGCANRGEREVVWRTYARALLAEQADRIAKGVGLFAARERRHGFVRWRKSRDKDAELPVRFVAHWRAMSDEELLDLEEALIRARYRGADQEPLTPSS